MLKDQEKKTQLLTRKVFHNCQRRLLTVSRPPALKLPCAWSPSMGPESPSPRVPESTSQSTRARPTLSHSPVTATTVVTKSGTGTWGLGGGDWEVETETRGRGTRDAMNRGRGTLRRGTRRRGTRRRGTRRRGTRRRGTRGRGTRGRVETRESDKQT